MKSAEEYYQMGREFADKYSDKAALVCYDIAIDLKPDFDHAYTSRGMIKKEMGYDNGAKQDFDHAIELNPQNVKAYVNRGFLSFVSFEFEDSEKDYDKALELAPDNVDALCGRGFFHHGYAMNYDAALCDIEKAIAVAPGCSSGYYYRGLLNSLQQQWKIAIADFSKSIEIEHGTENYKVYALRANAKIKLEQYASALQDLNRFAKLSPKPQQSKLELFDKQKNIGWLEQGRQFFRRSRQYDDADTIHDKIACILLAKECVEEALKITKPLLDYRETLAFGVQVMDILIDCKRNEKGVEKCPQCGGSLTYSCADKCCDTCGWSYCG